MGMENEKKCIGIIGGMGPLATCDLMEKIILHTQARCDQEHLHILVDNNTRIPDRTSAILSGGPDPVPEMTASARRLEQMGAQLLIMPCNTAHYFYDRITQQISIPLLHMPRETAHVLRREGIDCAGVLATDGTVRAGVYQDALHREGIQAVYPREEHQSMVMKLIYEYVKGGRAGMETLPLVEMLSDLRQRGARRIILGCTELPIAFARLGMLEGTIDPTEVLARAAIRRAGGTEK